MTDDRMIDLINRIINRLTIFDLTRKDKIDHLRAVSSILKENAELREALGTTINNNIEELYEVGSENKGSFQKVIGQLNDFMKTKKN